MHLMHRTDVVQYTDTYGHYRFTVQHLEHESRAPRVPCARARGAVVAGRCVAAPAPAACTMPDFYRIFMPGFYQLVIITVSFPSVIMTVSPSSESELLPESESESRPSAGTTWYVTSSEERLT